MAGKRQTSKSTAKDKARAEAVAEGREGDVSPGDEGLKSPDKVQRTDSDPAGMPNTQAQGLQALDGTENLNEDGEHDETSDSTGDPENPVDTAEGRNEPQPGSENVKPIEDVVPTDPAATPSEGEEDRKVPKKKVKGGEVEARLLFDSIGWANPDWDPEDVHRGQRSNKSLYADKRDTPTVTLPEAEYDRLEALGAVEPA